MTTVSINIINPRIIYTVLSLSLLFIFSVPVSADKMTHSYDEESKQEQFHIIPFALDTEQLDFGLGIGFGWTGLQQGQAGLYGAGLYTTNDSYALFLRGSRFQIKDRLFLDATFINGRYKEQRAYIRHNPDFPDEQGGTNDSSESNFLSGPGRDDSFELDFYYVLPIGDGKTNIIKEYSLADGTLISSPSGGQAWNPRASGRTYIHLIPFYRSQLYRLDTGDLTFNTNGIKLELEYDNRDFPDNPTTGSFQEFRVLRDLGYGDSSDSWTVFDVQFSKYISLGRTALARQRVIALNFWTADTPTWKEVQQGTTTVIRHRPPAYMGATLGGIYRLRAYPSDRFNDKSAIYYSAEYRFMPYANPLGRLSFLRAFDIDWWQFVGFVELGRVSPSWNMKEMHTDMQQSLGVGLRAMAMRSIVRLDVAASDESWQVYAMVGHPF